jgi:hypothetical protein
MYEDLDTP